MTLVLLAGTLFGTAGTALALAPDDTPAISAATLRLLVGGIALTGVAAVLGARRPPRRAIAPMVGGALGVAAYQSLFFTATTSTGVAVATLATIGVSPLASRLIGRFRGRPAPHRVWWLAALLLLLGLVVLVAAGYGNLRVNPAGVAAAVGAGIAYAWYAECGSIAISVGADSTPVMASLFLGGGVVLGPSLAVTDNSWVFSGRGALVLTYISLVTLTVAYVAFGRGLSVLEPTTVVMLTVSEPVVASVASAVVLDENLRPGGWIGAAVVMAGLPLVAVAERRRVRPVPEPPG